MIHSQAQLRVAGDNLTFICILTGVASVAWQPCENPSLHHNRTFSNREEKGVGDNVGMGVNKGFLNVIYWGDSGRFL